MTKLSLKQQWQSCSLAELSKLSFQFLKQNDNAICQKKKWQKTMLISLATMTNDKMYQSSKSEKD